jgi:integrase
MPKVAKALTAIEVNRLTSPGFHAVGTVAGLHLKVQPSGARSWIMRVKVGALRRDVGLGAYPGTTLADAWKKARAIREVIGGGNDPIEQRRANQSALMAAQIKAVTFQSATEQYIAAQAAGWSNDKHAQQWTNTLTTYAYPVIGQLFVRDIEQAHVLKILEPIWAIKTETATRVRGRIEKVLDWAKGRRLRTGENPAQWKGNLDSQLAAPSKIAKETHHAALPFNQLGLFMAALRGCEGMGARALEFTVVTATRSGETRLATWSEIDLAAKVWTIPKDRMKAGKEHRVPLSNQALTMLGSLPRMAGSDSVFPAPRGGTLSDMTLTAVIRRMNGDTPHWVDTDGSTITVHGFRSTFRDWAGETTAYPREVIEHALAHQLKDKAEAAYARGTLFDKRRRLMADWANFCDQTEQISASVTPIRAAA